MRRHSGVGFGPAEHPLPFDSEAQAIPRLPNDATAEHPLAHSTVKHRFVHYRLAAAWLHYPLHIDVNTSLMVSVNGGSWHGTTQYANDAEEGGRWSLTFHYAADLSKLNTTTYKQIPGTNTYLHVESTTTYAYNCMLIAKDD